jgi:hypothetical protein
MAIGAVVARIVSEYSAKGSKAAQKDIAKLGKDFDGFAKKATKAFGLAAAASAAFAVKIGIDSVKAAIEDQKGQALLANSLRNTVGATDEAIASVENYIDRMQRALGVADTELRPALSKLAGITGDLAQAQGLLSVALDLSAGATVSLDSAVSAIQKAYQGNFKALRNMGVKIDEATMKSKDFGKVLDILSKQFKGSAEVRAATFEYRMKRVGIAFDEAKETLGNALLPTVEKFFQLLTQKVIPAIQKWTEENGGKLVATFQTAIKAVVGFGFVVFKVFDFVAKNRGVFVALGVLITGIFAASKAMAFVLVIQKLVKTFQVLRAAALGAAAATAAATGGISVAAAAAGVAAFALTVGGAMVALKLINDQMSKAEQTTKGLDFSFEGLEGSTEDFTKSLKNLNINLGKVGVNTKNLTKEEKTLLALRLAIAKLGGAAPTTETDPIQLEAARLNLVKQGAIAEQARLAAFVAARKFETDANNAAAEAAMRYNDILTALADTKITPAEFEVLAAKWGITTNAAQLYVQTIISVRDNQVSASEVAKLAETWGVTYQEAAKYLDFFTALNDGTLSDAEIGKLQEKWSLTEKQVLQYAATFQAADDGKIDLTEVKSLGDQWGLTKKETEAYIAKILEEFGYDPSLLAAPVTAEGGWVAAYGSVESYKGIAEGVFTYDPSITDGSDAAAIGWISASAAAASYAAAVASANSVVIKPPTIPPVIPPELPKIMPPGFGGGGEPVYVPPRGTVLELATGGIVTSPTLSLIGEAGPEAVIPLSKMDSMGGQNITINVGGSVISEGDLVAVIRDQLLGLQQSGKSITLSAISI